MDSLNNKSLMDALNSHYDVELSGQEFVEAENNLLGFFEYLLEIDLEKKQVVCNENKNQ